jgi:DNA-binding NtrC family response regulator
MNYEVESRDILIVDDDEVILGSLEEILNSEGYSIETAKTGREAIKQTKKLFFNLALLDIKLPDMDGIKLLKTLKEISPRTAKIMITGFHTFHNAVESLNKGADAFLTKPINPQELLRVVNEKLHQKTIEESKDLLIRSIE